MHLRPRRGYRLSGPPELTAEKFLPNPWARATTTHACTARATWLKYRHHGRVQCLGRADDQVKIRGFRVELGEIEAVLSQQPGVSTCAVLLHATTKASTSWWPTWCQNLSRRTFSHGTARGARGSTARLHGAGPFRRHPAQMPRLTSGKIDRKALRAIRWRRWHAPKAPTPPQTEGEHALFAALPLVPRPALRRDADFFADLGGHSLLAARLASALRATPRFAQLTVRDIYLHRRIGAIAEALDRWRYALAHHEPDWSPQPWRRWRCGLAGRGGTGLVAIRMAQWLAPFFTYHFFTGEPGDSIANAVTMSVLVFLPLAAVGEFCTGLAASGLSPDGSNPDAIRCGA